ncbi:MAG: NADH-quinone oxidoreductase subunit L [Deltaproteobacteria bacterium]|nr:NADH-quinone oxidoreductase subunit L [Deltaproteobacteria bacterium]
MSIEHLALVAWLTPLAVAALLLVVRPVRHTGKPAAALSVAGATVSLGAAIAALVQSSARGGEAVALTTPWLRRAGEVMADVGVYVDGTSVTMLVVVTTVAWAVQVFSLSYMSDETPQGLGRYYAFQSLFLFSMTGLVLAPNMLQFFLAWELVGLCSYLLIGFWNHKPSAAKAALKAFWVTKLADIGMILALLLQFTHTGSFGWDAHAAELLHHAHVTYLGMPLVAAVALGFFVAAMGKSAQFPLHIWLPDAMEGPTPVSALLHAATMVAAGVYMVVRAFPIFEHAHGVLLFMAILGAFTALMAATIAVVQTDIKKVLAYSTVSQLGYMVSALGAGSVMAGYFHLTTHAFFKALLFLAAGSIIHGVHSQELGEMGGLLKKMRFTSTVFLIGTLALAGIPVFSGFFSKDLILEALLHGTHHQPLLWLPLVMLLAGVFLTAFYMGRVLFLAFLGEPSEKVSHAHEGGLAMMLPLGVLATLAVVAGFGGSWLSGLYGVEPYHFAVTPVGLVGLTLALAGLGTSWVAFGRGAPAPWLATFTPIGDFIRAGVVDRGFAWGYRVALSGLASAVAWFDRYVIDALVNLFGVLALYLGDRARTLQTGNVGDYVYAVIIGVVVFAAFSQVML